MIGAVSTFGVAIKEVFSNQNHTGLVFLDESDGKMKFLHLAWHYDFRCHESSPDYFTCPLLGFDEDELDLFAERASRLHESNLAGIPYGVKFDGSSAFNGDDEFINKEGAGLTCATFVLSFFKQLAIDLIDINSWKARDDDGAWQESIVTALSSRLSPDELEVQKKLIGKGYRFRPEEVVACAHLYFGEPIQFKAAEAAGKCLISEMHAA